MPTPFAKPIIKVYLLPAEWKEEDFEAYFRRLVSAAESVNALRVQSEKDLIILFPKDAMSYGLGTEIVVEIDLPASIARSEGIEDEVVSAIFRVTQEMFPKAYVQCKVYKFGTEHGYWATGMDDEEVSLHEISPEDIPVEALRISPQCRSKYSGEWLRPAQLTKNEMNEVLERLPARAAREMHELLMEKNNQPVVKISYTHNRVYHTALSKPVGGKYYRLASGTNRAGRYQSQLWEVGPSAE